MTDAKEYGKALFMLAEEDGRADEVLFQCRFILDSLNESPSYIKLLDTPSLTKDERLALIDEAFSSLDEITVNLVKILAERHMAYLLPSAIAGYEAEYELARGIERAEVISAVPLTEEQCEKIKLRLEEETGKTIIIKNTVDKAILGGIKLRYAGKQLDGSVKTRLDRFEKSLKNILI